VPVAQGPQINARSAVVVGLSGVFIALLIGAMVLWSARSNDVTIQLGDSDFNAGSATAISAEILDRGPILYSDVGSGGSRDIILQHVGSDPETGWIAFAARRTEDPRNCFLEWQPDDTVFVLVSSSDEPCDDDVEVDAAGTGLLQYPVEVIDNEIRVDLNFEEDQIEEGRIEEEQE